MNFKELSLTLMVGTALVRCVTGASFGEFSFTKFGPVSLVNEAKEILFQHAHKTSYIQFLIDTNIDAFHIFIVKFEF